MIAPVREGDVLAGKYRVERVLGEGGMGVVVAAHHLHLDERVAIKFLLPEAVASKEAVARFIREARAAVKIKSEHVARVIDVGTLDSGAPYMVMEYLEGGDLAAWVHDKGPLSAEQAAEFVLQACEAIAEAHALGIVHRDLKPANLFVVRAPDGLLSAKVLDFGISKMREVTAEGGMGMTATNAVMGSPLYMSPEQMASSKDVDVRTDVWSLGVVLYELLTGVVPFIGDTMPELVLKVVQAPTPSVRRTRLEIAPGLDAVIGRCLEKDRANRYENVADFARALSPFAPAHARVSAAKVARILGARLSASAAAESSALASHEPPVAATGASWGRTAANRSPTRNTIAVAVLGGLVLAATALSFLAGKVGGPAAGASAASPSLPMTADTALVPVSSGVPSPPQPVTASPPSTTAAPAVSQGRADPAAGAKPRATRGDSARAVTAPPRSAEAPVVKSHTPSKPPTTTIGRSSDDNVFDDRQ